MGDRWLSPVDPRDSRLFAPWVRDLVYENGVYAIRSARLLGVLYVGESHTGRLYDTLVRHLQQWKGWNAGPSYDRFQVECKTRKTRVHSKKCPVLRPGGGLVCPCGAARAALDLESRWISRLTPRDNVLVPADVEDVIPF